MSNGLEIAANVFNAASILLAAKNSFHTWWVGIVGCVLFGWVFFSTQLYADVTLQVFFIVTSIIGWRNWVHGNAGAGLPVRRTRPIHLVWMFLAGAVVTAFYGWLLHRFTNAFAPFLDSVVLAFSVLAQLLLMRRRYESWWCWLLLMPCTGRSLAVLLLSSSAIGYASRRGFDPGCYPSAISETGGTFVSRSSRARSEATRVAAPPAHSEFTSGGVR